MCNLLFNIISVQIKTLLVVPFPHIFYAFFILSCRQLPLSSDPLLHSPSTTDLGLGGNRTGFVRYKKGPGLAPYRF